METPPRRRRSRSKSTSSCEDRYIGSDEMIKSPANLHNSLKQWLDPIYLTMHYKTEPCNKYNRSCDFAVCPYYHAKKERRRSFSSSRYSATECELVKVEGEWRDPANCPLKDACTKCHTRMEQQFHPEVYKKMQCKDLVSSGACPRSIFCAFSHNDFERQGHREPEWIFQWEKILPAGVMPQYNFARRKSLPNTFGRLSLNLSAVAASTPINVLEIGAKKNGTSVTFGSSPELKIDVAEIIRIVDCPAPEPLHLSFAEALSGHKEDLLNNSDQQNENSKEDEEAESIDDEDVEEKMADWNDSSVCSSSGCITFADILSGARCSSEPLSSRIGKLNKIYSDTQQATFTPLPKRESNVSLKPIETIIEIESIVSNKSNQDNQLENQFRSSCNNTLETELPDHIENQTCVENDVDCNKFQDRISKKNRTLTEEYEDVSDTEIEDLHRWLLDSEKVANDGWTFPSVSPDLYETVVEAAALKALQLKDPPISLPPLRVNDCSGHNNNNTFNSKISVIQNPFVTVPRLQGQELGPPPGFEAQTLTLSHEPYPDFQTLDEYPELYKIHQNDFDGLSELCSRFDRNDVGGLARALASRHDHLRKPKPTNESVHGSGDAYQTARNANNASIPLQHFREEMYRRNVSEPVDIDEFNRHVASLRLSTALEAERRSWGQDISTTQQQYNQNNYYNGVGVGASPASLSYQNYNNLYQNYTSSSYLGLSSHLPSQMNTANTGHFNPYGSPMRPQTPMQSSIVVPTPNLGPSPQHNQNERTSLAQGAFFSNESGFAYQQPSPINQQNQANQEARNSTIGLSADQQYFCRENPDPWQVEFQPRTSLANDCCCDCYNSSGEHDTEDNTVFWRGETCFELWTPTYQF